MYQIFHPWHWLTYGQNASGVQAIAAVVATIAAIAAALYARGAYRETRAEVLVAKEQLELARKQREQDRERLEMERTAHARSEKQLELAMNEFKANRERDEREQAARRDQMIREEDEQRPRFRMNYSGNQARFETKITNVGNSTARNVVVQSLASGAEMGRAPAVHPRDSVMCFAAKDIVEAGVLVTFETDRGSAFKVELKLGRPREEEVIDVKRGY